jgi:hypothetical protein
MRMGMHCSYQEFLAEKSLLNTWNIKPEECPTCMMIKEQAVWKILDSELGCFLSDFHMFLLKLDRFTHTTRVDSNNTSTKKNRLTGIAHKV